MKRAARWLCVLGGVAAVAAWVLGQGGVASAAPGAVAGPARPAAPVAYSGGLHPGMHGAAIKSLQRRLARLHYYPGPADGRFGTDTLEAVWAFKEAQGISTAARADDVTAAMVRALAHPRPPRVLVPHGGSTRIEVNLARQVLMLYKGGRVELISHVSSGGGYYYPCPGGGTCGPAVTPDGNYRALWFARGWLTVPLGYMYNPVFFIGGAYAIHGDVPVPLRPVSHGCVRIPMDVAAFFHTLVHVSESNGTPVYVRGHAPGA